MITLAPNAQSPAAEEEPLERALTEYIDATQMRQLTISNFIVRYKKFPRWRKILLCAWGLVVCPLMIYQVGIVPFIYALLLICGGVAAESVLNPKLKKKQADTKKHMVQQLLVLAKNRAQRKGPVSRHTIMREARAALIDRQPLERAPSHHVVILKAVQSELKSRAR